MRLLMSDCESDLGHARRNAVISATNGVHWSGASIVPDGFCCPPGCMLAPPRKLGFRFLQAMTPWGSFCGRGFIACLLCGDPAMIGRMQSTMIPIPMLAPLGTKPACRQAALICA